MVASMFVHRIVLWIFTILLASRVSAVPIVVRGALKHNVDSENEKTDPKTSSYIHTHTQYNIEYIYPK